MRDRRSVQQLDKLTASDRDPFKADDSQLFQGQRVLRVIDVSHQFKYLEFIERVSDCVVILLLTANLQLSFAHLIAFVEFRLGVLH